MLIFHIALASEWAAAKREGSYTTSTLGQSLDQVGFIHASRREQVSETHQRFYKAVGQPLMLLTIDTDRLTSEWREDPVGDTTFPHIYGPLNVSAVRSAVPMNRRGGTDSFVSLLFKEMLGRVGIAFVAMAGAVLGVFVGGLSDWEWAPFVGALLGLVLVGGTAILLVTRRG